jgi:hypothetical protein
MSAHNNNSTTRERTNAAKEVDQQVAKSLAYQPKITIEKPSQTVPSDINIKKIRGSIILIIPLKCLPY